VWETQAERRWWELRAAVLMYDVLREGVCIPYGSPPLIERVSPWFPSWVENAPPMSNVFPPDVLPKKPFKEGGAALGIGRGSYS
jgi:hypothetical protein